MTFLRDLDERLKSPLLVATAKGKFMYKLGSLSGVDYGVVTKRELTEKDKIPTSKDLVSLPSIMKFDGYTEWTYR